MAEVELADGGVVLDGSYLSPYWLRDNCPTSFDPVTRERVFDLATSPGRPSVVAATIDGEALALEFADGHHSRFDIAWLVEHAGRRRPDPAAVAQRRWHADAAFTRADAAAVVAGRDARQAFAHAVLTDGIAIATGLADTDDALVELAESLGHIRPSVPGPFFDVRVHVDPVNQSYTANELELHTDTPAELHPPGIQFLHCRRNTVSGGLGVYVDGLAVAEALRAEDPDAFDLLASTPVPFFYDHDDFDWRSRHPVIQLDADGSIDGLRISVHMADVLDLDQRLLDRYYPALHALHRRLADERFVTRIVMEAGTCVVFDNHRVVHGRDAYDPASGERYLRGCYVDRGELRSTYRTLAAHPTN